MKSYWWIPLHIALVLLIAAETAVLSIQIMYARTLFPRLTVGTTSIGGFSPNAAALLVQSEAEWFLTTSLSLTDPRRREGIVSSPRELGIAIDVPATIARARTYGRSGNALADLRSYAKLFGSDTSIPAVVVWDDASFGLWRAHALSRLENPARNFSYEIRADGVGHAYLPRPAIEGEIIDMSTLQSRLFAQSAMLRNDPITLPFKKDLPILTHDEGGKAKEEAEAVFARAPYQLSFNGQSWEVSRAALEEWLAFVPMPPHNNAAMRLGIGIDRGRSSQFFNTVSLALNKEPVNAVFAMENGRVTTFVPAQDGLTFDREASIAAFESTLASGTATSSQLAVHVTPPAITQEQLNQLGIHTLLGRGESDFSGSPINRIHNIKVGAARYHGVLIKPGEEFSFVKYMGKVNAREGYRPALVIKNNQTIYEYGGGLCQVSTTAFRAAIQSGLPITERHPHAFPVRYYNPQGYDASVYAPSVDFRFKNDTSGHILIQTRMEGTKLIFEFYGTSDGRTIEVAGPYEYDRKPTGALKAYFIRRTTRADGNTHEDKFYSSYRSQALYPVARNPLE